MTAGLLLAGAADKLKLRGGDFTNDIISQQQSKAITRGSSSSCQSTLSSYCCGYCCRQYEHIICAGVAAKPAWAGFDISLCWYC
jgi:hypothetical protein